MSISTKQGDDGKTSLLTGERVFKDDLRVRAYGTGDELIAFLGELKYFVKEHYDFITEIQKILFKVNASLACEKRLGRFDLSKDEMDFIERKLDEFENEVGKIKEFIIPAENIVSAKCEICRTICRRFEREIVTLSREKDGDSNILKFVNRLSDCLFLLARIYGKKEV